MKETDYKLDFDVSSEYSLEELKKDLMIHLRGVKRPCPNSADPHSSDDDYCPCQKLKDDSTEITFNLFGPGGGNTQVVICTNNEQDFNAVKDFRDKYNLGGGGANLSAAECRKLYEMILGLGPGAPEWVNVVMRKLEAGIAE